MSRYVIGYKNKGFQSISLGSLMLLLEESDIQVVNTTVTKYVQKSVLNEHSVWEEHLLADTAILIVNTNHFGNGEENLEKIKLEHLS